MLRGNLASRPFYNERLVSFALVLVAMAVVALTVFNVSRLLSLSAQGAELDRQVEQNRAEAERVRADATSTQQTIDGQTLQGLVVGTREANALIDRRTFSWTAFFDVVEDVLPFDVRLVAVAHREEDDADLVLVLNVVAKSDDDLNDLIRGMLGSGVFYDVLPAEKTRNDDNTWNAIIETGYLPPADATVVGEATPGTRTGGHP